MYKTVIPLRYDRDVKTGGNANGSKQLEVRLWKTVEDCGRLWKMDNRRGDDFIIEILENAACLCGVRQWEMLLQHSLKQANVRLLRDCFAKSHNFVALRDD